MSQLFQSTSYAGAGEHLFLSEELSDVTILVQSSSQSQWRYPAHRLVLSSQSSVFRRMLESNFSEKSTGSIIIADIKPKIIELLLGYMYRGRVSLQNWRDGLELLRAAHKYQVEPLVQFCSRFLENMISISNVCYFYNEACLYSLISLKEKCLKLILDAGFIVLRSKAFEILEKDSVMDIITNSDLNIDSELMVFEALLKWSPMQCCRVGLQMNEANILQELTPFLKYVCFDDMSDTDKSALPPAVLSCVKPNNRNRIAHHVPDSLLQFSCYFNFHTDQEFMECVGDALNCISFSLDASQYMIGLKFMVVTPECPPHLILSLVKVYGGSTTICHTMNLYSVAWKEGLQMNERKRYEAQILLRQPCRLDPKTVYKLLLTDRQQNTYCPKTKLHTKALLVEKGHINLSLHTESVWGVMGLIFL
ncbi:BTB/POZ domain-containing protein 9-like [Argiope bruennichi]|uniref:BTB/POZ domain-containing protein 9-like n=1 Tax=Argiope bruennichi TaxID=94029 RepID=UPI002494560D|nr:BTB/POZ domain-containing protein 9-like [Argiope bruennichi]XP_055931358.1 BTB/POZ domain-containing protein 9-like [Argiope bruennichi]